MIKTGIPPHNLEAERAVLGAILLEPKVIGKINLKPDDFYRPAHQKIFEVMRKLYLGREVIDLLTITDMATKDNCLDMIGGASYLSEIANEIPTSANIIGHSGIIKDKMSRRTLLKAATTVIGSIDDEDIETLRAIMQGSIKTTRGNTKIITARDLSKSTAEGIEETIRRAKNKEVIGIPSGFIDIDRITHGWQPTDLIFVGARPGMGKTSWVGISCTKSAQKGNPVGWFALEMGEHQTGVRHVSDMGDIPLEHLLKGVLKEDEYSRYVKAMGAFAELPIYYCFEGGLTIEKIAMHVETMVEEYGVKLVVIDYLQLMKPSEGKNREEQVSHISREAKALAKKHKIPIIALAQLNRSCEARTNKRPLLSDLRESGALEQDADVVMFLYRHHYYHKTADPAEAECIFTKNRNGRVGTVKLLWQPEYTRFRNLAPNQGGY